MKYYSTNKKAPIADLHKAVVKGLAEDRGLYMPEIIKKLPQDFFDNIAWRESMFTCSIQRAR